LNCSLYQNIDKNYHNLNIRDYLRIYTINDVRILKDGLDSFSKNLKELNIPFTKKNHTCSSISFNFYLKCFNKINLNLPSRDKNIINQAYFGGKCEVYGNPKPNEKILHFDFSGMYNQCMQEILPYGEFLFKDKGLDLSIPGFYYIEIEYYNNYPILPIKTDKLFFPNGLIRG